MPTCGPAGRKKPSEQEGLLTRFQASGAPSHPRVEIWRQWQDAPYVCARHGNSQQRVLSRIHTVFPGQRFTPRLFRLQR